MPKKLKIKAVIVKKIEITPHGQLVKLTFPFTSTIARQMGWPVELPENTRTWSPEDCRVQANFIEFTPNDPGMVKKSFRLECHGLADSFAVVRKASNGQDSRRADVKRTDVSCTVAFADEDGAQKLTAYMRAVPLSEALVNYDPAPVQETLPGTEQAEEDTDQTSFEE